MTSPLAALDHLVYAAPDLAAAVDAVERMLGIRASPGGSHPRWGTRNALIAFGPTSFLEIIGPDRGQPPPSGTRPFGIDTLAVPQLITWAIKSAPLERLVARARGEGVPLGDVIAGRRERPDGVVLAWQLTDPTTVVADGIVPFAIDWGDTPHPAATAVQGASLVELRAEHPDAARVSAMLKVVGVDLDVRLAPRPKLVATIDGRKGRVEIDG